MSQPFFIRATHCMFLCDILLQYYPASAAFETPPPPPPLICVISKEKKEGNPTREFVAEERTSTLCAIDVCSCCCRWVIRLIRIVKTPEVNKCKADKVNAPNKRAWRVI
ncbi:hypothetical protein BX666DRAFT_195012 [Dichotomocladium elegans]|nr:hypothetical protein BX666DRAFT_195012 [Dichotomocladium elegans]